MKLTPKQVRYIYPFLPGVFNRVLRFSGRRNTLQLQETALVMEGELVRFGYIGLERLIARALSEWSTITVPYGRIVRFRFLRRRILRSLIVLGFLLVLLFCVFVALSAPNPSMEETFFLLPVAALLALLAWVIVRAFAPCHALVYRTKDGKTSRVTFRIKNRKTREEFVALLAEYRSSAKSPAAKRGEVAA